MARKLSLSLSACDGDGDNLAITGPTGSGKSALCRVIGGLWPLPVGELALPHGKVHICSQHPLVPTSAISLRDFVTYPSVLEGDGCAELERLLDDLSELGCKDVVEREGMDTVRAWHERLSLGEQQTIAIVRLLHHCGAHNGSFVFLDDCLSAVADAVVEEIYGLFAARGIRVVTCTQALKQPAARFHGRELRLGESCEDGWAEHGANSQVTTE